MAKKKNKRTDKSFSEVIGLKNILQNDILNFILGILLLFLSIYMIIAFISYFATGHYDQSLILDHSPQEILNKHGEFKNSCGSMGAFISYFMISRCFGLAAFIIPFFMGLAGLHLTRAYKVNLLKWFICLMIAMEWFSVAAAKILTPILGSRIFNPGGDHGLFCCQWLENVIGVYGLTAVLLLTAIVFLTYLSKETINVVRNILNPIGTLTRKVKFGIKNVPEKDTPAYEGITTLDDPEVFDDPETQTVVFDDNTANDNKPEDNTKNNVDDDKEAAGVKEEIIINKPNDETKANSNDVSGQKDLSVPIDPREPWTKYKYPTLDLLKKYENDGKPYIDMKEQTANKNRIVEVLNSFGVQIKTIMATVGPTITLYEITPAEGVKISKIREILKLVFSNNYEINDWIKKVENEFQVINLTVDGAVEYLERCGIDLSIVQKMKSGKFIDDEKSNKIISNFIAEIDKFKDIQVVTIGKIKREAYHNRCASLLPFYG